MQVVAIHPDAVSDYATVRLPAGNEVNTELGLLDSPAKVATRDVAKPPSPEGPAGEIITVSDEAPPLSGEVERLFLAEQGPGLRLCLVDVLDEGWDGKVRLLAISTAGNRLILEFLQQPEVLLIPNNVDPTDDLLVSEF